jgi:hypothetical protein
MVMFDCEAFVFVLAFAFTGRRRPAGMELLFSSLGELIPSMTIGLSKRFQERIKLLSNDLNLVAPRSRFSWGVGRN